LESVGAVQEKVDYRPYLSMDEAVEHVGTIQIFTIQQRINLLYSRTYTVNIFSMNFIQKLQHPHGRNIQSKIVRMHSKRTGIIRKQRAIFE
jgi:hypothetical protein